MWLTKNEKEVLKLLLSNGKLSDTSIAKKLNISTQATGRIRKRLEEDVIVKYSVELDKAALGANIIARMKIKCSGSLKKDIEEEEKRIIAAKNNMFVLKPLGGEGEYDVIAGFRNMEELNETLEKLKPSMKCFMLEEIRVIPFSHLIKYSSAGWSEKLLDSNGVKHPEGNIN